MDTALVRNASDFARFKDSRGVLHELGSGIENKFLRITREIRKGDGGSVLTSLRVRNISGETLFIDSAAVLDISVRRGAEMDMEGKINSWTMLTGGLGPGVRDLCNPCHNENKLDYYSPYYSLLGHRPSGKYIFLGFVSFGRLRPFIYLKADDGFKFESLQALCDFSGAPLAPGAETETETLLIRESGGPAEIMRAYMDAAAPRGARKGGFKDITGWATWDYYQSKITEEAVLKNADWLAARRPSLPVEYIQLDHGFQKCEGDWLVTNGKFPHGLGWLASQINKRGFKAGIWLCPFLADPRGEVCLEHPDWVIKTASGLPLEVSGYTAPKVYALDCSLPEVCDWVGELGKSVTFDLGFEYIKLDMANTQGISPLGVLSSPGISKTEAFAKGLKAFRGGLRKGTFLLCGSLWGPSIGLADAMRVGEDTGARWDASKIDKHHGERDSFNGCGEILRAVSAAMNHYYSHRRLWINDPDYLVVRQKGNNSELSYAEAQTWASVAALSGGLLMLSDNMTELAPRRVRLLEKVLPHCGRAAEPLDFFRKNVPSFYSLKDDRDGEERRVLCVLNPDYPPRVREYTLKFKDAGLSEDKEYHVFDFWKSGHKGLFSGSYTVSLRPRQCQALSIRENLGRPQILGTDTHISCGGLEIESSLFKNDTLEIKMSRAGKRGHIFIFVPDEFTPARGLARHRGNVWKTTARSDGGVIRLLFHRGPKYVSP
jgi:alpha-galactosidase